MNSELSIVTDTPQFRLLSAPAWLSEDNDYLFEKVIDEEGHQYLRKIPRAGVSIPTANAELAYEYKILSKMDSQFVIKPIKLIKGDSYNSLLFELVDGTSLAELIEQTELEDHVRYQLAIALIDAISALHEQKLVHQELNPHSVIFDFSDSHHLRAILIDIRHTQTMKYASSYSERFGIFNRHYFSPEQTGRVNQPLDHRTDYYNLGLLLYELFTNKSVFHGKKLQDLVYEHVAIKPNLSVFKKHIALKGIIGKLLDKAPGNRYQSLKQLRKHLVQAKFQPDVVVDEEIVFGDKRLDFSGKLYGRDRETTTLLHAAKKASLGSSQLVFVSGYSGVGKSALIRELHRPVCAHRGYFLSGKFEQIGLKPPLGAFIQAFHALIEQRLAEPEELRKVWQSKLIRAVGPNASILCDVLPELRNVLGDPESPEPISPNDELNRFISTFKAFVKASCDSQELTVIFLDDMQWADNASITLLEHLCQDTLLTHIQIVCGYRDNEVDAFHPLTRVIESAEQGPMNVTHIALHPLSKEEVLNLLSDSLEQPISNLKQFADVVYDKAQGNPFFTIQLMDTLWRTNLLVCYENGWQWDIEKIKGADITDNVVELVTRKIALLPENATSFLLSCSAVGSRFSFGTIVNIMNNTVGELLEACNICLKEGFIQLLTGDQKALDADYYMALGQDDIPLLEFKFAHDKVQQSAYELIESAARPELHVNIGRSLYREFDTDNTDDQLYEISSQINLGLHLLTDDERHKYLLINYRAGIQAKKSGAYSSALELLLAAQTLLPNDCWKADQKLSYDVHLALLQAQYLSTHYEDAGSTAHLLLANTPNLVDKVPVYMTQILSDISNNCMDAAVQRCIDTIEALGFDLVKSPILEDSYFADAAIRATDKEIESLENLPEMTDELSKAALSILALGCAPAYFTCVDMFEKFCNTMLCICLKEGNSPDSAYAYAIFGLYSSGKEQYRTAYRFCEAGVHMMEKYGGLQVKPQIYEIFNVHVKHWVDPFKDALPPIHEGVVEGKRTGGIEFASYNAAFICPYLMFSGKALPEVVETTNEYWSLLTQFKQDFCITYAAIWIELIQELHGNHSQVSRDSLARHIDLDVIHASGNKTALYSYYQAKSLKALFAGNYATAYSMAVKANEYKSAMYGMRNLVENEVYMAVGLAMSVFAKLQKVDVEYIAEIQLRLQKLEHWNNAKKDGEYHKLTLVKSMLALIKSDLKGALNALEKASNEAMVAGYLQDYALIQILALDIYKSFASEHILAASFNQTIDALQLWGGHGVELMLAERFPELSNKCPLLGKSSAKTLSKRDQKSHLQLEDMTVLLESLNDLSKEMDRDSLQRKVLNTAAIIAGAEDAAFLMLDDTNPQIVCVVKKGVPVRSSDIVETYSHVAVNYCLSTRGICQSGDAINDNLFVQDNYIHEKQVRSILCFPIIGKADLLGIICLENNVSPHCFGERVLDNIRTLLEQSAISLENAALYTNLKKENEDRKYAEHQLERLNLELERRVDERTHELGQSNEDLEATISHLKQAQNMLVESAKMASLGELVAGIAHEINTPIGVSLGAITHLQEQVVSINHHFSEGTLTESGFEELISIANESTRIVEGNLHRASKLIQSFKRVAVDQSSEHAVEFELVDYINEVITSLKPKYKHMKLDFDIDDKEKIKVFHRPGYVAQIITNLTINAIIHGFGQRTHGVIKISFELDEDNVRMTFSDNGKGVKNENIRKIFEPFYTTKRGQGGSGLGLHIVYNIVTQTLNGRVSVNSIVGEGTTFTINFPLRGE
jgi:predicted ATPase/signal transduction histidine kinase